MPATYPYGMYGPPAVGNGLGGLPRRTNTGPLVWRAVGQPITVSNSNYKGAARDNIAVDRSTNTLMLMENNGAGTNMSATAYTVTTAGVFPIGTGSTTNATWYAACSAGANNYQRRIVGARGTFWSNALGYSATISGGTITFGTTAISVPSTTPLAEGGTLGASQSFVNGTLASSNDGRLFCYCAGSLAPVVEIDAITRVALRASTQAANNSMTYNYGVVSFGRYIMITDDNTTPQVYISSTSLNLLSWYQNSYAKTGYAYTPTNQNGYAIILDPIDENTFSINTANSYADFSSPVIYNTSAGWCMYGSMYYDNTSSVIPLGSPKGGAPGNNFTYGDMIFQYSQSGIGASLVEKRFLVGDLPTQRITPTTTDNVICFSVGQNLAVVIAGTSMQAYYRS